MSNKLLSQLARAGLAAVVLGVCRLPADLVETRDGAHLLGKITKIDAGAVTMATSYAGTLTIKQSEITAITTDRPISVRLVSGTRIDGAIVPANEGLRINGTDGAIATNVTKIAAGWPIGQMDPALAALQRHWKYEATADINGTSGNKTQLGIDVGFGATLTTPADALQYSMAYNRQVTENAATPTTPASTVKSADQFKAGVDYTSIINEGNSWFIRDVGGFDRVMGIKFYDTAAIGLGHDLIKNAMDTLTGRIGLAYRYTGYTDPRTEAVNSAAADLEIAHDLKTTNWELVNRLAVVPAFADFKAFIMTQDSYFQMPLTNPAWKLRIGLANNFNNRPPIGIKKLDTTYYTRLILDWQ